MRTIAPAAPRNAAEWFAARRRCNDADLEERFSRWITADPGNAEEYALCELTWELSATAAEGFNVNVYAGSGYRRRSAMGLAAAACLAFIAVAALWLWPPTALRWQTAPGEQRAIVLEDGSRITLNTRSALEARLGRSKRQLRLLSGEAFFDVTRDPQRPFVVETAFGTARAVGTRFNVLLDSQHVEVATEEGQVMVTAIGAEARGVLAPAGVRATILRGQSRAALDHADLSRIENWRAHRLEFNRVPLAAALREFSRYTAVPIRAATPEVGRIPVSAVLKAGDVVALRSTLSAAFGLRLVEGRGEWLVQGGESTEPDR